MSRRVKRQQWEFRVWLRGLAAQAQGASERMRMKRNRKEAKRALPQPEGPTTAVISPVTHAPDTSCRIFLPADAPSPAKPLWRIKESRYAQVIGRLRAIYLGMCAAGRELRGGQGIG